MFLNVWLRGLRSLVLRFWFDGFMARVFGVQVADDFVISVEQGIHYVIGEKNIQIPPPVKL